MIGILGSGFGLYGYLPAAINLNIGPVILPISYKDRFFKRKELGQYENHIIWADSEQALVDSCTALIISKRPSDQFELLPKIIIKTNIKNIILEKPLATNPSDAHQLESLITKSRKKCSVSYIFRNTLWASLLRNKLQDLSPPEKGGLKLRWSFMAHHFSENLYNWKSEHAQGGGVIRFYGIHLIALLAELGYTNVNESFVIPSANLKVCAIWKAKFTGKSLPDFDVEINSESNENYFEIKGAKNDLLLFSGASPFDHKQTLAEVLEVDIRHAYLEQVLMENFSQNEVWPTRYSAALRLWEVVETCTLSKNQ